MSALGHALAAPLGAGAFISGVTVPGVATLVLSLEPGTKIVFSFKTNVVTSYSGKEQRESTRPIPQRKIEGPAFLLDADDRKIKGTLVRSAPSGAAFGLALPFESEVTTAATTTNTVPIADTASCDWAIPGARVTVIAPGGAVNAVVQSITATTIALAVTDASGASTGASLGALPAGIEILPIIPVLLEPQQGFARYPVTVDLWALQASAATFGFAGVDSMGAGAELAVYGVTGTIPVADLEEDDLPIWDRINVIDGTANESMLSRTDLVDLGGLQFSIGGAESSDWVRSVKIRSTERGDWQWFKAMIRRLRGQQGAFLLNTNRPDLFYLETVTGGINGIKVRSVSAGGRDVIDWFVAPAHRRLAIVGGGAVQYTTENLAIDNGDGTVTLGLDNVITGTVTKVSFLEQVRLTTDDIEVSFDGGMFSADLAAVTVQESISTPRHTLFDAVFSVFFSGFLPPPPYTISVALGQTTLILWSSNGAYDIAGIHNTLPAGNADGMVACVVDVGTHGYIATHNSGGADGLMMSGGAGFGGVRAAIWFRYHGGLGRWINFWRP